MFTFCTCICQTVAVHLERSQLPFRSAMFGAEAVQNGSAAVVGNNNYEHYSLLGTCKDDANAIHRSLSSLTHFQSVQLYEDLTRNDMEDKIVEFCSTQEAQCMWLHFSGHGEATENEVLPLGRAVNPVG